ncbi:MAG: hypothetical protein ACKPKO_57455, partial [Candidatus Fonsibacter sp.]
DEDNFPQQTENMAELSKYGKESLQNDELPLFPGYDDMTSGCKRWPCGRRRCGKANYLRRNP